MSPAMDPLSAMFTRESWRERRDWYGTWWVVGWCFAVAVHVVGLAILLVLLVMAIAS